MTQQRWRLDGQTALITGASAGIGLAIAHELAGFGADLMIVGRDIDMLETARDELLDVYPQMQVHALAADVSDDEDRRQILDWVEDHSDGLHILVNNAGGNVTKAATEYSEDEWRQIFETNLFSAFELSRYAHPLLARHASSSIVNVGSVSGLTHAQWRGLHEQGGDAPDDPQPRGRMGRGRHPGQRGGALVYPHPAHLRPVVGPGLLRGSDQPVRRCAVSASRRKPPPSVSCACRRPATSPASASQDGGFLRYGF